MFAKVKDYLLDLQNDICQFVESEDGKASFIEDAWHHGIGGGGKTRVLSGGGVIEKAGVNFSHVHGFKMPKAATAKRPEFADADCEAMGVSVVIHPENPYVPTSHFNVRCISVDVPGKDKHWWFGGGFDLTPYYGFEEDCKFWHQTAKEACDPFGDDVYARYKKWADDYFYLKHRDEQRGIGGIFYDDLNEWEFDKCFDFMRSVGSHYIKAYQPIVAKRKLMTYEQQQRDFQLYRRGRYVEFNLIYDRGTIFGLQSNGRTESILMSLPPVVEWHYGKSFDKGTPERELYDIYLKRKDWLA